MKSFTYTVTDELGLHARPASQLVKESKKYKSTITVSDGVKKTTAAQLMMLMSMGIKKVLQLRSLLKVKMKKSHMLQFSSFLKIIFKIIFFRPLAHLHLLCEGLRAV